MSYIERARALRKIIEQAAVSLSDEVAETAAELFPKWETDKSYAIGDRCRYENLLYKCVQAHTSQVDWTPDKVPALFVRTNVDEFPEWVQPSGVHDAYNTGDKVSYHDKHWICQIDSNVYAPDVFGWGEI